MCVAVREAGAKLAKTSGFHCRESVRRTPILSPCTGPLGAVRPASPLQRRARRPLPPLTAEVSSTPCPAAAAQPGHCSHARPRRTATDVPVRRHCVSNGSLFTRGSISRRPRGLPAPPRPALVCCCPRYACLLSVQSVGDAPSRDAATPRPDPAAWLAAWLATLRLQCWVSARRAVRRCGGAGGVSLAVAAARGAALPAGHGLAAPRASLT